MAAADLGRERLDVHDDEVEQADAVLGQLLELARDVAAGEDPGVDRRVERPHLPADERRDRGQVGDRGGLDPVRGEMLTGAVGGIQLDAELLEVPRESRDPLAVGDREQRTHLRGSSSGRFVGAPFATGRGTGPGAAPGLGRSAPSIAWPRGILGPPNEAGRRPPLLRRRHA